MLNINEWGINCTTFSSNNDVEVAVVKNYVKVKLQAPPDSLAVFSRRVLDTKTRN
jgi:hypothetical protein